MNRLSEEQENALANILGRGAAAATDALSTWLERPVHVNVDCVQQLTLQQATESMGPGDATLCACVMEVSGCIQGQILFCFDDPSGLALSELLSSNDSLRWSNLEQSAALETANIVGCSYLNSLANAFSEISSDGCPTTCVPTPPLFIRDFAASIIESTLALQAFEYDLVLLARTVFQIEGKSVGWSLLVIPDAASLNRMATALA
jgi:chemotaxis protein CheC